MYIFILTLIIICPLINFSSFDVADKPNHNLTFVQKIHTD